MHFSRRQSIALLAGAFWADTAAAEETCSFKLNPFEQEYIRDARLRAYQSCRKKRRDAAVDKLPEDYFGHRDWRRKYIAFKGDRRIVFEVDFSLADQEADFRFAAYEIDSGLPFATRIWVTWNGVNDVLLKKTCWYVSV